MNAFLIAPYLLEKDDLIEVRVRSRNSIGWATAYSDFNTLGVTILTVPSTPLTSPRKGTGSSDS